MDTRGGWVFSGGDGVVEENLLIKGTQKNIYLKPRPLKNHVAMVPGSLSSSWHDLGFFHLVMYKHRTNSHVNTMTKFDGQEMI